LIKAKIIEESPLFP